MFTAVDNILIASSDLDLIAMILILHAKLV